MKYANAETMERAMAKAPPRSRQRCTCGCGKRASHLGTVNGIGMTMGCEWHVRRWVKRYR